MCFWYSRVVGIAFCLCGKLLSTKIVFLFFIDITVFAVIFENNLTKIDLRVRMMANKDDLKLYTKIRSSLLRMLDIRQEKEEEQSTVDSIKQGIEFKGTTLWVLIIAILIASLGLNVNSTAVIIGAMLISPLMGPIIGFGLGLGINDFELIKKAAKNFGIATGFSIVSSTLFFLLSPLSEAQSELLARTQPTIYDVLIAFFGGMAGIIAGSSRFKGNVIPGVAIATALMPPLCTAGFGLATRNFYYFGGAIYLYLINSVFICLATFLVVRVLNFKKKEEVNNQKRKKVTRYITVIAFFTIIPCLFITYDIVRKSWFENSVNKFINHEISLPGTYIINKTVRMDRKNKEIKLITVGEPVSEELLSEIRSKLPDYGLEGTDLIIREGVNATVAETNIDVLKNLVLEDFYQNAEAAAKSQAVLIDSLTRQLEVYKDLNDLSVRLMPEFKILFPAVREASVSRSLLVGADSMKQDTVALVYLKTKKRLTRSETAKMEEWMKVKTGLNQVKLIVE